MAEAKWIVKSSGRILGPVSLDEIVEAVRSRTFSALDEMREPRSRWSFLREHPALQNVVRQLREEQSSGVENTQSTYVTSNRTVTSSVTERLMEEADRTPDPTSSPGMKSISGVEKNVGHASLGAKSFGVLSDQKVQSQLQRQNNQLRYLLYTFGVVLVVAAVFYWRGQSTPSLSASQAQDMVKLAQDLASRGEYNLAYKTLIEVELQRGLSPADRFLKLKLLLVKDDASPLELSQTMEALEKSGGQGVSSNMDLLRGLTQAKLGRHQEAAGSYQNALQKNPASEEATLNFAASAFLSGDLLRAWASLQNLRVSEYRPYYQVLKSLVALRSDDPQKMTQSFEEFRGFDDALDRQLSLTESNTGQRQQRPDQVKMLDSGRDLRFERLLLNSLLAQKLGQTEWVDNFRRKLVQTNPLDAKNYLRSPYLDWQIIDWPRTLRGHCESFRKGQADDAIMRSTGALCLAAAGDLVSARNMIEGATRQYRGDTTVVAVDALLLQASGRETEADRIVQMYAVTDRNLIHWVRGEICEKRRDSACADRAWTQLRSLDPFEPRAFFGLAKAAKDMMNDQKYIESIALGPKYAPNYAPLLALTSSRNEF